MAAACRQHSVRSQRLADRDILLQRTLPGLSIGSSSSCFVAFAFPCPFAASATEGFFTAAGFVAVLVVVFAGTAFVLVVAAFAGLPFYQSRYSIVRETASNQRED